MPTLVSSLLRRLLAAAGIAVIVVALALGTFRLLLAQLPEYQAELKAWVDDTLGLTLTFDRLDVHLGLRGPELTFYDVAVATTGQSEPFLVAERAAVVVDPWALLKERELRVSRLRFDGTHLTLERGADGELRLQDAPAGQTRADLALLLPLEIEVAVRDSGVVYVDPRHGIEWAFEDVSLSLRRRADVLQLEATAEPPAELASRVELAAQEALEGGRSVESQWRVFGELGGVDLAVLSAALPREAFAPSRGFGDVSVWLEWTPEGLARGMIDADVTDVAWPAAAAAGSDGYEHVSVSVEWQRRADGWRLMVNDIGVTREGRTWPVGGNSMLDVRPDALALESHFLRLEDLTPLIAALPRDARTLEWLELDPRGDLSEVDLDLERRPDGTLGYTVAARFDRLGIEPRNPWPGFDGLSGELRADTSSGRAELETGRAVLDWPRLFRAPLDVEELAGLVVWREGYDSVRVVSDDFVIRSDVGGTRSNLELTLPLDGSSPQLDLQLTVAELSAVAAKRYLPARVMPAGAVAWLDSAIQGGRITGGQVELVGPLRAFPFDGGEGVFRGTFDVEDGTVEFVDGWPRAEDLDGTIELRNASFTARGGGRVLGNVSDDLVVGIDDLREAVLTIRANTSGPLADVLRFLKESPLIARYLGPGYGRLNAPAGVAGVSLDLALPLTDMAAYELTAGLDIAAGELAVDGFGPSATDINGTLTLAEGAVGGAGIEATFLDGPVTVGVAPPDMDGYRARIDVDGEITAAAAVDAFSLPISDHVAGQTRWRGTVLIPSQNEQGIQAAPLRVAVTSNLSGVALNFPAPFAKAPGVPTTLQLDFAVEADALEIDGHLGASRRFALDFGADEGRFGLRRGALRFGGELPEPASSTGLTVDGALPALQFDEWLALARSIATNAAGELSSSIAAALSDVDLEIMDLSGFGQQLGSSRFSVRRGDEQWMIDVDSLPVAGSIAVPYDAAGRPQIVASMQRLHVEPRAGSGFGSADPRRLLGLSLSAESFSYGTRRLGGLRADIRADPVGLRLVAFEAGSDAFALEGSGGWFDGPDGPTTRLAFSLNATDVAATLSQLALEPLAEGSVAEVTASVYWPGAPSADWTQHLGGDVALRLGTGSLLDIDPGAGRVVGLMSISALPRRLALDFRDVFNRGLVFDEISGDFAIVDGNAYTDNLKVTGPVAEIGVAGRIGIRDRDYRQQAVVTAEPGKMLPTVGGLIGGPGVGAALLIFTRIFKEPLKGIGRASYCVTGSWEQPVVERLSAEQLERGQLCAELPADRTATSQAVPATIQR
jgi:uncharacterized protein (TIGR02099 family)